MSKQKARQDLLIDALRELSALYWPLEEKLIRTPAEREFLKRITRARRAIQHDCEQAGEELDDIALWLWKQRVLNAGILSAPDASKRSPFNGKNRDYPSNLSADQLPLPETEG